MLLKFIIFLSVSLSLQHHFNTEPEYLFRNFTVQDGLPVNTVYDIVQNKKGDLYLATHDGLVLFDGYNFTVFQTKDYPELINQRINRLLNDPLDRLWISTADSLLLLFEDGRFTHFSSELGIDSSVIDFTADSSGTIWVGTHEGLLQKTPADTRFRMLEMPEFAGRTSSLDLSNELVVVNEQGFFRYRNNKAELLFPASEFPFPVTSVHAITYAAENSWWIYGRNGFFLLRNGELLSAVSRTEDRYSTVNIAAQYDGSFLVADIEGFFKIDIEAEKLDILKITPPTVNFDRKLLGTLDQKSVILGSRSVFIGESNVAEIEQSLVNFTDREGILWIGTLTSGLWSVKQKEVSNLTSVHSHPIPNVYSFLEASDGAIWIASTFSGIHRISEENVEFWNKENGNLIGNGVRYLYEDRDQTLYTSIYNSGLWKLHQGEWKEWKEVNEFVNSTRFTVEAMFRDSHGRLLIGSTLSTLLYENGEISYLTSNDGRWIEQARTIRELQNGSLLFATNGFGLGILKENGDLTFITDDEGLSSNYIRDIVVENDGKIWVVTENAGLNRILLNNSLEPVTISSITTSQGLHHNSLHRMILCENGYYWISSNRGVIYLHSDSLNLLADGEINFISPVLLDETQGMQNRELNGGVQDAGRMMADGTLWFPNMDGIVVLNTDEIIGNHPEVTLPEPQIRALVASGKSEWTNGRELYLERGNRNFRITFSVSNFKTPNLVRYYHRLHPVQSDWQNSTESRSAEYTSLPPGRHLLEIVAESPNLTLSRSQFLVIVPSFYYETVWFRFLIAIAVGSFLFFLYSRRVKSLYEWNEVQGMIRKRTEELKQVSLEKEQLISGITHDLKTPISMILGATDSLLAKEDLTSADEVKNKLRRIKRNSFLLNDLVSQMLEMTKIEQNQRDFLLEPLELVSYSTEITDSFEILLQPKSITLEISGSLNNPVSVDRKAWERILYNLMSNAIKFSDIGGIIQLHFRETNGFAEVLIRDFGKGISAEEQKRVFEYLYQAEVNRNSGGTGIGLWLVNRLMEGMNGTVRIVSAENSGTTIALQLRTSPMDTDMTSPIPAIDKRENEETEGMSTRQNRSASDTETSAHTVDNDMIRSADPNRRSPEERLTAELASLPSEILLELLHIVEDGDATQVKVLISKENQLLSPPAMELLFKLAEQYDYLRLTNIINKSINLHETNG